MTDEFRTVKPDGLPRATTLLVSCPDCGASIEYEVVEDDAGNFYPETDWPVCEPCEVLIDVPTVAITDAGGTYHVERL